MSGIGGRSNDKSCGGVGRIGIFLRVFGDAMSDRQLSEHQRWIRRRLLSLYHRANCGHIACSLSCIDIISQAFRAKTVDETFILSKGHAAGALYVVLNEFGIVSDQELETFYGDGTRLAAHPSAHLSDQAPFGLGSLGHGFPLACGVAYAKKQSGCSDRTFVLMSDGETNEGTTWEAAHFAVRHALDRLIVIIDKNGLQGFGRTEDVLGDTANAEVWKAIGFDVQSCNGHDELELQKLLSETAARATSKPLVVMAETIKGFGVPFMEDRLEWHYLPLNDELYAEALQSLREVPREK